MLRYVHRNAVQGDADNDQILLTEASRIISNYLHTQQGNMQKSRMIKSPIYYLDVGFDLFKGIVMNNKCILNNFWKYNLKFCSFILVQQEYEINVTNKLNWK